MMPYKNVTSELWLPGSKSYLWCYYALERFIWSCSPAKGLT